MLVLSLKFLNSSTLGIEFSGPVSVTSCSLSILPDVSVLCTQRADGGSGSSGLFSVNHGAPPPQAGQCSSLLVLQEDPARAEPA